MGVGVYTTNSVAIFGQISPKWRNIKIFGHLLRVDTVLGNIFNLFCEIRFHSFNSLLVRFTESTKILNEKSKSDIEFSYFQGTQKAILVLYMLGLLALACFVPKESFLLSNFSSLVEDEK